MMKILLLLLSITVISESTIIDVLGLAGNSSVLPAGMTDGCLTKNNTYFMCCVEYKALICFEGQYLQKDMGIEVALIINHQIIWQEIISATSPPEICPINIPDIGEVCFKFYDIDYKHYHFCLNLTIKLDVIHRIPLKKIHMGCLNVKPGLPEPLNCSVNNITDVSFSLYCQEKKNNADNWFLLDLRNSNNELIKNETAITSKFDVSPLQPATVYHVQVFAVNKYGRSLPAIFNITTGTAEEPVLQEMVIVNLVANIYLMYAVLFLFVLCVTGFLGAVVLHRTCSKPASSMTFAQMKEDLASKLLLTKDDDACLLQPDM